jgi:hypothetical protein
VVSFTTRPLYPRVSIGQEAGWAPEPVWTTWRKVLLLLGLELRPLDRAVRSQSLYRLSYPGCPIEIKLDKINNVTPAFRHITFRVKYKQMYSRLWNISYTGTPPDCTAGACHRHSAGTHTCHYIWQLIQISVYRIQKEIEQMTASRNAITAIKVSHTHRAGMTSSGKCLYLWWRCVVTDHPWKPHKMAHRI